MPVTLEFAAIGWHGASKVDCVTVWLCDCVTVRLCDCVTVRLCDCVAV